MLGNNCNSNNGIAPNVFISLDVQQQMMQQQNNNNNSNAFALQQQIFWQQMKQQEMIQRQKHNPAMQGQNNDIPNAFALEQQMFRQQMTQQEMIQLQQAMLQQQYNNIPNNFQPQPLIMQQNMFPQIQSNTVAGQQLFNDVITKIMPYTKTKWIYKAREGLVEDGEHTFRDLSLTLEQDKLQNDILNEKMDIGAYRNNLTYWLNQNNPGIAIVDGTYGTDGTTAKKLDNNTVRIIDATGDFVVDFCYDKLVFYAASGGNGTDVKKFFNDSDDTNIIKKIEYDIQKNVYKIFIKTNDGWRQIEFVPRDENSLLEIGNIHFSGHELSFDVKKDGANNGTLFEITDNDIINNVIKNKWNGFCTTNNYKMDIKLIDPNEVIGQVEGKDGTKCATNNYNTDIPLIDPNKVMDIPLIDPNIEQGGPLLEGEDKTNRCFNWCSDCLKSCKEKVFSK